MTRLSRPIQDIAPHYDVVVVGSGYGGAIAACRLARAGARVCVLERGREFEPGDFPDTGPEAAVEFQVHAAGHRAGNDTALFDLLVGDDINVLVGCGLGGTSLINANVALRADPRVFEDTRWPASLRADIAGGLEQGYERAEAMLRPAPLPAHLDVPKVAALESSARAMGLPFYRPPVNVTFETPPGGVNHAGVPQRACILCGDCVAGCNHQAKNTVAVNYLPDARTHGAQLFTRTSVRRVGKDGDRWLVHYRVLDAGQEQFDTPPMFVSADVVVLAAGSLGSTEILLRSRAGDMRTSDRIGHGFSGNGDLLGFGYNNDVPVNGIGFGAEPGDTPPVGPCIAGIIDARDTPEFEDGMVIEEGAIPGALRPFLPAAFGLVARLAGTDTDEGLGDRLRELGREVGGLFGGAGRGALHATQTYLVMTHDDGEGRIVLDGDRPRVVWPGVGRQPIFEAVSRRLHEATAAL
ncbi:MAG: GMC family oxidoreductase N-terminal domain-containing protein, partial [Acidimicrobiales bacterium]